jgi:hypothetical protein
MGFVVDKLALRQVSGFSYFSPIVIPSLKVNKSKVHPRTGY